MTIRKIISLLFLLFVTITLFSQTTEEKQQIKRQRLSTIDLYHFSIGIDTHFNQNLLFSPKISLGIGSFRNKINADAGIKYTFGGSAFFCDEEHILVSQLPLFASTQFNLVSWEANCAFVGGEIAYCIPIVGFHYLPSTSTPKFDKHLCRGHFYGRIKVGTRINRWEIGLFYEYDFAPMMNQKYVYESPEYDYDILRDALFERARWGLSLNYNYVL